MNRKQIAVALGSITLALTGCAKDTWTYRVVPNTNISRPNQLDTKGALVLKSEPENAPHPSTNPSTPDAVRLWLRETDASAPAKRTVMVASWQHESSMYHTSVGRTLVIFIDGQPKPGQYWLTADNAVLLTYSAYTAPSRERVNLSGSVRIKKVQDQAIIAEIAVRDTSDIDSSNGLDRPWDPVNQQFPFELNGEHSFAVTTPSDPMFEKAAVKWLAQ